MIENAAVFVNGRRKFKGVDVEETSEDVIVKNRTDGSEVARWSVVDVGKAGMAWDVQDEGALVRLVVQTGCGCSGMKPYLNDEGYSGPFTRR